MTESQDSVEQLEAAPAEQRPARRWRADKPLLIVSALVAVGLFLIVRGLLVGITGDERANLPDLIDRVDPVPEAVQVLSQSGVFVDLAPGHTGVLVIDGIEIETVNVDELGNVQVEPGQQIEIPPVTIYEAGNSTLTFTPSEGAPITGFDSGEHTAQVIYWRIDEGRQRARSFTWTFNVV
ncbi:MAG: hypothetical protein QNJ12_11065 [Ilumatobacter sp.]|uniref:hypothetical protein n=1 Tax=Ilumatobacter sp. TaxID=1967498 RepID=UPI00263446A5|nr:hypothetical protein [Ilumatobacter sp.]MDJ0769329.1 hypothetical protein [Ilumatobacter sp.]